MPRPTQIRDRLPLHHRQKPGMRLNPRPGQLAHLVDHPRGIDHPPPTRIRPGRGRLTDPPIPILRGPYMDPDQLGRSPPGHPLPTQPVILTPTRMPHRHRTPTHPTNPPMRGLAIHPHLTRRDRRTPHPIENLEEPPPQ